MRCVFRKSALFRRFLCWPMLTVALMLVCGGGCASSAERLPSEDIEVPKLYSGLLEVLRDPKLPANSREKYEAIGQLIEKVDFKFTREIKTVNELLGANDAIIDSPRSENRIITYNYQHGDHYIRLKFYTYRVFVHRVDITRQ